MSDKKTMNDKTVTRNRAPNFSKEDQLLLFNAMEPYAKVLKSKKTDTITKQIDKQRAWLEVTDVYNANTKGAQRSTENLISCYRNVKSKLKKQSSEAKMLLQGGGPSPSEGDPVVTIKKLIEPQMDGHYTIYDGDAQIMNQFQNTKPLEEQKQSFTVLPNNDLEKRIIEAFEVFDHSGKQVVDVREVGTILRSLGCCPTEAEVQEVILATESKEATGNVPLANFLRYMVKAMIEHKFYPATADALLAAFKFFDDEGVGYLPKEKFLQLMTQEGEPFTQEEVDEMMQVALDPVTDQIAYEFYINQLMVVSKEVFDIADELEQERLRLEAAAPKKKRASSLLRAMQVGD